MRMANKMTSKIIALQHMSFLLFFWYSFAFVRAAVPDSTWSTDLDTWLSLIHISEPTRPERIWDGGVGV